MVNTYDNVTTRDQLGKPEDKGFFIKESEETVIIEEGPIKIEINNIGNSWIVGSSTNGLVGTNTGTVGGSQQVVGSSGRSITTSYVVNTNNIFIERFTTQYFEYVGTTTADWGDTEGTLKFTSGEIAESLTCAKDGTTWLKATLSIDNDTNLTLQLSADGGSNWETVNNGEEHFFTNTGTDLRFKIISSGTTTVTLVKINYEG